MSDNTFTAPHERTTLPAIGGRHMTIRQERAAIAAMESLHAIGARVGVVHRLPHGLGYVDPDTGYQHGPADRSWLEHHAHLLPVDHAQLWPVAGLVERARRFHAWKTAPCALHAGHARGPCTCRSGQ